MHCSAQDINVLFLGNSYTQVNELPQVVADLAASSGHTIYFESFTPGGCTFDLHSTSESTLNLIRKGCWDYVVLQEQSQLPTIDHYRYSSMYPAAERLHDSIKKYNPCAALMFYMTWGRENGGQQCEDYGEGLYCSADFRDFDHMQDSLTSAYSEIAERLEAYNAPAGEAWRNAIHQTSIDLFANDGSHPSIYGTYLTACVFHGMLWDESPVGLNTALGIDPVQARLLQEMAEQTLNDETHSWNHMPSLQANFRYLNFNAANFAFINTSINPFIEAQFHWSFGDGTSSEEENPTHTYEVSGVYKVLLTIEACQQTDTISRWIEVHLPDGIEEKMPEVSIYPNPVSNRLFIEGIQDETEISIYDPLGQIVWKQNAHHSIEVDLSKLAPGHYLLRLTGQGVYRFKLIKK